MPTEREMPKYKCHKVVHALKIKAIRWRQDPTYGVGAPVLDIEDEGFDPVPVTQLWLNRHDPKAGGYYVVYADGYASFSPQQAFEEGYRRLDGQRSLEDVCKALLAALDSGLEVRPGTLAHRHLRDAMGV